MSYRASGVSRVMATGLDQALSYLRRVVEQNTDDVIVNRGLLKKVLSQFEIEEPLKTEPMNPPIEVEDS